jgi:hypothetical protein
LDLKPTLNKFAFSIFSLFTHTVHRMISELEYFSECELIFKAMNQGTRLILSKKNEPGVKNLILPPHQQKNPRKKSKINASDLRTRDTIRSGNIKNHIFIQDLKTLTNKECGVQPDDSFTI